MSILVTGTFRVPAEQVDRLRPHMVRMIEASRAEDGCEAYDYAIDVLDPGLVHVHERWRDQASLDRHLDTDHLAAWRSAWAEHGVSDRHLTVVPVTAERVV